MARRNRKAKGLQLYQSTGTFEEKAFNACNTVASNPNTRDAYALDLESWLTYAREYGVHPGAPTDEEVGDWVTWMKDTKKHAPKTRARRIAAMSTVFRRLRKNKVVPRNPFSVE